MRTAEFVSGTADKCQLKGSWIINEERTASWERYQTQASIPSLQEIPYAFGNTPRPDDSMKNQRSSLEFIAGRRIVSSFAFNGRYLEGSNVWGMGGKLSKGQVFFFSWRAPLSDFAGQSGGQLFFTRITNPIKCMSFIVRPGRCKRIQPSANFIGILTVTASESKYNAVSLECHSTDKHLRHRDNLSSAESYASLCLPDPQPRHEYWKVGRYIAYNASIESDRISNLDGDVLQFVRGYHFSEFSSR